jgi:NADPH:quinone reductase
VRAVTIDGGRLVVAERPDPEPGPGELLVRVAATGPDVQRFRPGDRVMAMVGGGGQAELAVVHERTAIPVPDGLGWPEAGGVGTAAVQLGAAAGARVVASVRNPDRHRAVADLGAAWSPSPPGPSRRAPST